MAVTKIDTDGMPYWSQYPDTHLKYAFNWGGYVSALGSGISISSATISCDTSGVAYSSITLSMANNHTFHVSPSAGNAGSQPIFTSKVFFTDGQADKAKLRIKVLK